MMTNTNERPRQTEPAEGSRDVIDEALENSDILNQAKSMIQNVGGVERLISAAIGLKLVAVAFKKLGFGGLLASGIAAGLLSRAATGHCSVKEQLKELSV